MRDEDIDFSEIPEVTDWTGATRGRFYRPIKQQLTLRLDADVVAWFKAHAAAEDTTAVAGEASGRTGEKYQTAINRVLREYVTRHRRSA